MKCEYCGKYEARTRDYREFDGITSKFGACWWCANLNNVAVYQIMHEGKDPISFYDDIDYMKLDIKELQELRDFVLEEIEEQIDDENTLSNLLEMERALTLREE